MAQISLLGILWGIIEQISLLGILWMIAKILRLKNGMGVFYIAPELVF